MDRNRLRSSQPACKRNQPAAGFGHSPGPFTRFSKLVGAGSVLMMTGRFGRSPVRDVAYRLRDRCSELAITLSWQLFTSLKDWGERWPAKQDNFAAGLILTATTDPTVERAVGRCLADLARLGRPVLWGVIGQRVRWRSRFALTPNGWPPELISPNPGQYARLRVADDTPEFRPRFDPILYSPEPDFRIGDSGLWWWEARFFHWMTIDGERVLCFGYTPDD